MPQILSIEILPKTRQLIAGEYGVTVKVLNAQIERHHLNILHGCLLFPKQQKMIYETLGYPNCVHSEHYKNV